MKHLKINGCPFSTFTMNYQSETYMRIIWRRLHWDKACWKNLAKAIIRIAKETQFAIEDITYREVVLWLASKQLKRTGNVEDLQEYQNLRLLYR